LLAALALIGISVFGLLVGLALVDGDNDSSGIKTVESLIRVSLFFGQLLGALIFALLVVNFTHDLTLAAIGGLSAE